MGNAQILIVEDDAITAMDIKNQLKSLGYGVTAKVSHGKDAIKQVKENTPDLVLMDIVLKGEMDGIEAADEIRSQFDIPIVFLTAYADRKRLERAKLTTPFGFIMKPFQDKDFRVTIEMALYIAKVDAKRKQAEETLRESEERMRSVVETSPAGIAIYDETGQCFVANDSIAKMVGATKKQVLELNYNDIEAWKIYDILDKAKNVIKENISKRFELIAESTFGQIVRLDCYLVPFASGQLLFMAYDITERIQAEKALRKSEKKYRDLFESNFDGIAESDLEGNLISCNMAYRKMTGHSEEEIKKLKYQDLTPLKWAEVDKKHTQLSIERGYSDLYEKERIHKDGTVFPVSIRIWLRKDEQDNPEGFWGIVRDISQKKQAEETLRESEKKSSV